MGGRGGMGMGMGRGMGMGMGGGGGGRNFSNDLYADYNGPDGSASNAMAVDPVGSGLQAEPAEPNQQILIRNVSPAWCCP